MPGCVIAADFASPERTGGDTVTVRRTVDARVGCQALAQSVLECAPGRSRERATGGDEEVLFVLQGHGALVLDDDTYELEPETGAYLAPGESYRIDSAGPLRIVSVRLPDPIGPPTDPARRRVTRRLADQQAQAATTDRQFRIVADPETGLRCATHFVGYIPTARAPDHFHRYDEVIYVIDGRGVMRMNGRDDPLSAGSCIHLPARTVHCLENVGDEVMRVVAVFRPAGSPAAAFYPDGTPAYQGARQSSLVNQ